MEDMFKANLNDIENYFERKDIFIVDRGFRDCLEFLKKQHFIPRMPGYLPGSQKQYTDLEANLSRIITAVRWVVEAKNGQIKKFLYFNNVVMNTQLKYLEKDFKIICALLNKYREKVKKNEAEDYWKALEMLNKVNNINGLSEIARNYTKRTKRSRVQSDPLKINFPKLNESYIKSLTCGIYQLKQARSYTNEHLDENGNYIFEIFEEEAFLLRVKIKSRFRSQTIHGTWIQYSKDSENPIKNWYCDCQSGARTLGACAHVTSVLWYLGIARHDEKLLKIRPSQLFIELFKDAADKEEIETENLIDDDENKFFF
jgi:hypothetical protein